MSSPIVDINNDAEANKADVSNNQQQKSVLFFWADWHAPSASGAFHTVIQTLATQQQDDNAIQFYRVLAEETPSLSQQYNVTSVPTFIFRNVDGTIVERIDGGEDVARVTQAYSRLVNASTASVMPAVTSSTTQQSSSNQAAAAATEETSATTKLNNRLQSLITSSPIMLFLKGTPNQPKCGFSRQAIEMLTSSNVTFGYFNILEDNDVRQGLKVYSDWPTYPQLYVRGELVGGLDIMKELMEEDGGGLVGQLELSDYVIGSGTTVDSSLGATTEAATTEAAATTASLNDKLKQLITRHRIMLFMKGIPSSPECGFSRQIVEILDSYQVSYDAFNILEDEDVRQGLKVYSDWPTYPQLYVEGDLVGGLDIVREMEESGDLKDLLTGENACD
jgi:Grx4 family monothiol glutaredoxin